MFYPAKQQFRKDVNIDIFACLDSKKPPVFLKHGGFNIHCIKKNLPGFENLEGGVLNLVLAFASHFFNMSLIYKIVGVETLCLQPGTGCGIVAL